MLLKYSQVAENQAVSLLKKKKYVILARNIRFYGVEIDIITKKKEIYTFFEVKRRQKSHHAALFPTISYQQKERYHHSIMNWYEDIQKIVTVCIGLLVFDENMNLIEFQSNL